MAFSANRIALLPARFLFGPENIQEVINERTGKPINYTAIVKGRQVEDSGLLHLCAKIVSILREG
jgi:hypothetical protein